MVIVEEDSAVEAPKVKVFFINLRPDLCFASKDLH